MDIVKKLHRYERIVLPLLLKFDSVALIVENSSLQYIEVMRAVQWLENKKLITVDKKEVKLIYLGINGLSAKEKGLPEIRFLKSLKGKKDVSVKDINLEKDEINVSIGALKRKVAIDVSKNDSGLIFNITSQGLKLLEKESLEEKFLKKEFPVEFDTLKDEEKFAYDNLSKRKDFLEIKEDKSVIVKLTDLGKKIAKLDLSGEVYERLTSKMLQDGSWKGKEFRAYDVEINVPKINGGKRHFVNQAVEYIKKIWTDMGFVEMTGNYVSTAFWDLDALFVPQDHPAREMQDTFYVEGTGKLPKIKEKIKYIHETGGDTGSKGWQYNFSFDESKKLMLRTHTTVLSAHKLDELNKSDLPAKFFAVDKVFRNEALDASHLFEFYQVEGIVVDPKANFKHLKGYLKEFYGKMGFPDVRLRPAHFPYTEPSVEVDVFHPVLKKWIELGGAGLIRPEVTKALLGFECPVLAWGNGMGRIISQYWNITDIRELYKNDLKQLKEMKFWMR